MSGENADPVSLFMELKLTEFPRSSSDHCIFKVHDKLRRVNDKAYEPTMVAIGPYHRGKPNLQEMEKRKGWYLQDLVRRAGHGMTIDRFVTSVRELEEAARKSYAHTIGLDADKFVEMLLLDGCFIVELFFKYHRRHPIHENDPLFISRPIHLALSCDLTLFENQIPFFVLSKLFEMTVVSNPQYDVNIIELALNFLKDIVPNRNLEAPTGIPIHSIKHLLGLVRESWCFEFDRAFMARGNVREEVENWEFINSATELQEAGVQFKKVETSNIFDIKFVKGVLEIPSLRIEDSTELSLSNLIAYEQLCLPDNQSKYVTDYIIFMNCLIISWEDVQLLRRRGIIENWVADDGIVVTMLNKMIKYTLWGNTFSYSQVFNAINGHCRRRRNVWMATLRRKYFNNPWASVSFLAAVILLLLTLAQTVFSILSFTSKK